MISPRGKAWLWALAELAYTVVALVVVLAVLGGVLWIGLLALRGDDIRTSRYDVGLDPVPSAEQRGELAAELAGIDEDAAVSFEDERLIVSRIPGPRFVPFREALEERGFAVADAEIAPAGVTIPTLDHPAFVPYALTYFVLQSILMGCAGWLLIRYRVPGAVEPASGLPRALGLGLLAGVAALVLTIPVGLVMKLLGLEPAEQEFILELARSPAKLALFAPAMVVLAPLVEEVFFRGYVFAFCARRLQTAFAFVASAILFGLLHGNLKAMPIYVVYGLVFAEVYRRTGRLAAPIAAHVVVNATALFALFLTAGQA